MAWLSPDLSDDSFTAAFTPENHSWNSCIESYLIKKYREENIFFKKQHYPQYYTAVFHSPIILQEQYGKVNRMSLITFNDLGEWDSFHRHVDVSTINIQI